MMNKQEIEKALNWFKPEIKSQESGYAFAIANGQDTNKHFEDWLDYMRIAVECMEQRLTGGWIPVTERWPDKSGRYLVTYHEWTDGNYLPKYDDICVKILRYQDAVFKLPVCCDKQAEQDTHREVLAWMPLPEPYKED